MLKRYLIGVVSALIILSSFSVTRQVSAMDTGIYTVEAVPTATAAAEETENPSKAYPSLKEGDNGPEVVNLQSRLKDLGYYNYKVTGYFGSLTVYAVTRFQKYNNIDAIGKVGPATNAVLYSNEAVRLPMDAVDSKADRLGNTPTPKPTAAPTSKPTASPTKRPSTGGGAVAVSGGKVAKGSAMSWSQVTTIFSKGTTATVIDYATGVTWTVKRTGGSKHADVEPVSAADTAKYKQALGKGYGSWTRHSCIVLVKGYRLAASYHGYPHGYNAISGNNMSGHYCIHFKNSRTHCSNKVDANHQACVKACATDY